MKRRSGTNAKSLVLRCMPLVKNGVGSAWGLPVIASGKERLSALSVSEQILPPFAPGADPFGEEKLFELEKLGIGALGRFRGGGIIKPAPLSAEDFFAQGKKRREVNAAELFCAAIEFEKTYWIADGSAARLFHTHLEFLRSWGFSGGVHAAESSLAALLADYIAFLQSETANEACKIIILVPKQFFKTRLSAKLPMAKTSADTIAGEIPVNFGSGGIPVLSSESGGPGIVLYEDAAPVLRARKTRCDILITVDVEVPEIQPRLKLTLSTEKPAPQKNTAGSDSVKSQPLKQYLYRNLFPVKSGGNPASLPFPALRQIEAGFIIDREVDFVLERAAVLAGGDYRAFAEKAIDPQKAEALGLLPQWEAGRVEAAHGAVFAVTNRFAGIGASGFKEEQTMFYAEEKARAKQSWEPPPVRPDSSFSALNEIERGFFLRWRSECRRGRIRITPNSPYMETYIRLYAGELALCMGRESPMQHFIALSHLLRAAAEHYPETAAFLCKCCVDFIVIYGLAEEAFPLLLDGILNNNWFAESRDEIAETEELLTDLAIVFFFVESNDFFEKTGAWALLRRLIPRRVLDRKNHDDSVPARCCRTLAILDSRLRADWHKSFFTFFSPPLYHKVDFTAFEKIRLAGSSSYTVCRPGFSAHKPLIDVLSALVLNPDASPLPELKARLHPLSLKNELIDKLRKESDAVRELLKTDESTGYSGRRSSRKHIASEAALLLPHSYTPPDTKTFNEFIASLTKAERQTIQSIMAESGASQTSGKARYHNGILDTIGDSIVDSINTAFYEQFGDLLLEQETGGYSISPAYLAIMDEWE